MPTWLMQEQRQHRFMSVNQATHLTSDSVMTLYKWQIQEHWVQRWQAKLQEGTFRQAMHRQAKLQEGTFRQAMHRQAKLQEGDAQTGNVCLQGIRAKLPSGSMISLATRSQEGLRMGSSSRMLRAPVQWQLSLC